MRPASRTPPVDLRALGRTPFPAEVCISGRRYRLQKVFKHDFFAVTGLMESADGRRIVLKIGRTAPLLGWPAAWVGAWLAGREARIYRALRGVRGIPAFAGTWGRCGMAHEYVAGHSLSRNEKVSDEFFDQLENLLREVHARDMAYVDLEKCANVLVGDDGRPWLIDFQISWHWPGPLGRRFPLTRLLRRLQHMDHYHLLKHRRKLRPDQLSAAQLEAAQKPPGSIRLHRLLTAPLQQIRRAVLRRLDPDRVAEPR